MVKLNIIDSKRILGHSLANEYQEINEILDFSLRDSSLAMNNPKFTEESIFVENKDEPVQGAAIGLNVKDVGQQMKAEFEPKGEDFLKARKELIEHVMKRLDM